MTNPTSPLRLKIIDRFVDVLEAVEAGSSYWASPAQVVKRWISPNEAKGFPVYGVFPGPGQAPEEIHGEYTEEFEIVVKGVVQDQDDTVTLMERSLADIRKAIDTDSRSGAAGSLGEMCVECRIGATETDEGEFSVMGLGFFDQRFTIRVAADPFGA